MDDQLPIPKMLLFLFGEAAEAAHRGASPRLLLWCQAFDDWLDERRRNYRPGAIKQALLAWRRLLPQQGKLPWDLAQPDIEHHAAWLAAQGFAPTTIRQSLGIIANFYRWCAERQVDPDCPPSFNPAAGVPRPKIKFFAGASLLSRSEVAALLGILRRDTSPLGRREYAFFLARLHLGVRLQYLQNLRWGQIEFAGAASGGNGQVEAWVRWRPAAQPVRLPDDVWEAIRLWLVASGSLPVSGSLPARGRSPGMRPGDHIFSPLVDSLQHEPIDRPEAWARDKRLSTDQILRNLKIYGGRVGIPEQKLTLLALRRTAIRLRLDAGDGPEQMQAFVDSQGLTRVTHYRLKKLPQLSPDAAGSLTHAPESIELAAPALPVRTPSPFKPGERITHGLYAHSQPPEQVLAIISEDIQGIEAELAGLRLLERGLLELQGQARSRKEKSMLAQAYTQAAVRLGMMVDAEKQLEEAGREGRQADLWAEDLITRFENGAEDCEAESSAAEDSASQSSKERSSKAQSTIEEFRAEALGRQPELALADRTLLEEVAGMRLVLRNTLALAGEARQNEDLPEYIHLVDIYGKSCSRLLRLLRAGPVVHGRLAAYVRQYLASLIEEVTADWVKPV